MDRELMRLRARCERAIAWHGVRAPERFLEEIAVEEGVDTYGEGGAVDALEAEVCRLLGKPAAAFMPSGTMAQQIALRVHADRRGIPRFAIHPTSHVELHEDKAYQRLHGLVAALAGDARSALTAAQVRALREPIAAFLFELPLREIGGRLPPWDELVEQVAIVRAGGAAAHLDGARVWECSPWYRKDLAEIAGLFDSVYVSFYKGFGGLAGACLAGEPEVIDEARAWRRRHGGTLWSLWPLAASALGAMRRRLPLMPRYYEHARAVAAALAQVPGVQVVPDPPQTPMMHLHIRTSAERFDATIRSLAEQEGIWTWAGSSAADTPGIRVAELVVGDATLEFAPAEVATIVERFVG